MLRVSVRAARVVAVTQPKPAKKVGRRHRVRNTTLLALLVGGGFVGAAAYAQEDREFAQQFEHYVPGARKFMQLAKYHDNSVVMALSDVAYDAFDHASYTARFVYEQMRGLVNMVQHNSWQAPGEAPKPEQPRSARPKADKTGAAPTGSMQVAVELPSLASESAEVVALSKAVSALAESFNRRGLSGDNVQQLKALGDALLALDKHLGAVKAAESGRLAGVLETAQRDFDATLADANEAARTALAAREAQLISARDGLLREAEAEADERLRSELAAQRDLLERRFNRFVRARVDEERGGRLAHVDRVEAQLHQLTQAAQASGAALHHARASARLSASICALRGALDRSQPFASELAALAGAATTDFPATRAAVQGLSRDAAETGIASQADLEERFDTVRSEIRSVSLVPDNGSFGSQVLSAALSKVMFEKEGMVEGEDVESVLARSAHYLTRHDLDLAARELNQLTGWPRRLADDWIKAARARLEVEQALSVAQAEEQLARLALI
ncbi:MICOS complex subunit mic60 [Coemansia sp. RSA 552]|nr:MICOS complex subunit mic60 [Coemansia sp. RSA 552]